MKTLRKLVYLVVVLCFTTALAQAATPEAGATCNAMVQQALNVVQQGCASTARNQACYGYVALQATPRTDVTDFSFSKAGDLANVADIDSLSLSALDTANKTWGIALMKLQANLPDTIPGQNVTFLMFGDVQLQNAVSGNGATVQLTSASSINVRATPATSGRVVGTLGKGDSATANGRNADNSWLRIQLPNSNALGWVFASLVKPASDVSALSVVDASQTQSYTPMQAFYFQTGITQTGCASAPPDGILIQTPQGAGQITLNANDVDIQLGSTALLQAQPNGNLTVSVVEGEGHITANNRTVAIPAGAQATVPLDANLKPSGAPTDPVPYDPTLVANLPIQVLPLKITIATPATAGALLAANTAPTAVPRASGGSENSGVPGLGGNLSDLTAMNPVNLCATVDVVLKQTGMTKAQYIALLEQTNARLKGQPQAEAQLAQYEQDVNACP